MIKGRREEQAPAAPEREVSPLAMYQAGQLVYPFAGQDPATPLELYGAQVLPDLSGMWVYAFQDPGARVWYAGQTDRMWSRFRDHFYDYGERFTRAAKWVIPVPNVAEADLLELVLIHFYDPECNTKGRRADLEKKVHAWGRGDPSIRKRVPKAVSLDSGHAAS